MLNSLTASHFESLVNQDFTTAGVDDKRYPFKLTSVNIRVTEAQQAYPERTREAFSLAFEGPENLEFIQGTVELEHPSFSEPLPIFMVAVGEHPEQKGRLLYQAVFN
ncbi:MAG: hypothetical protein AB7D03_11525 [Thiomicrospira sp.]